MRIENARFVSPQANQPYSQINMMQHQGHMISGIDPTYLASYSNNNAGFIAGQHQMQLEMHRERQPVQYQPHQAFGSDYQNRNLMQVERNNSKTFSPQIVASEAARQVDIQKQKLNVYEQKKPAGELQKMTVVPKHVPQTTQNKIAPKKTEAVTLQNELQNQVMTRFDKLKALHKTGPRAFSGPIEKVLKWHKALQDIGVLIIYETVAKCVSIRPGESCSKNLVIRDDNGPAMQVVYYEVDFLLPELKPPCTVRVIGRMIPGTCRLQAFNVRPASGDDVATLPRRAAVATHHVAKLCKEYGKTEKTL